jgi:hypothetical protein
MELDFDTSRRNEYAWEYYKERWRVEDIQLCINILCKRYLSWKTDKWRISACWWFGDFIIALCVCGTGLNSVWQSSAWSYARSIVVNVVGRSIALIWLLILGFHSGDVNSVLGLLYEDERSMYLRKVGNIAHKHTTWQPKNRINVSLNEYQILSFYTLLCNFRENKCRTDIFLCC